MAERFVTADRMTPMLLPEDLREWLGENGLVHSFEGTDAARGARTIRLRWCSRF